MLGKLLILNLIIERGYVTILSQICNKNDLLYKV
jgi:hypothetical protein